MPEPVRPGPAEQLAGHQARHQRTAGQGEVRVGPFVVRRFQAGRPLAVRGHRVDLTADRDLPTSIADLAEFGVAYVYFAMQRPALFRLMFGNPCNDADDERVQSADALHELLGQALTNVAPGSDTTALANAGWSLAHGLAFLHLDGKLSADSPEEIAQRVRSAFLAIMTVNDKPKSPRRA